MRIAIAPAAHTAIPFRKLRFSCSVISSYHFMGDRLHRFRFFAPRGLGRFFEEKEKASNARASLASWRSGWDSNPRALADNLISSQARCDHFDTAPSNAVRFPARRQPAQALPVKTECHIIINPISKEIKPFSSGSRVNVLKTKNCAREPPFLRKTHCRRRAFRV